ncbi:hypothetical protein ACOME3_003905, partial [Neoechinorhynchus agilis]
SLGRRCSRGAVPLLSSFDSFAQGDNATQILRSKQSCSSGTFEIAPPPIQDRTPAQISELKKVISFFANGSGHGFDGLRPQHLSEAAL